MANMRTANDTRTQNGGVEGAGLESSPVFPASFPLLHLDFGRLQERSVLFLFALLSFRLEGPPTVHSSVPGFLSEDTDELFHRNQIILTH